MWQKNRLPHFHRVPLDQLTADCQKMNRKALGYFPSSRQSRYDRMDAGSSAEFLREFCLIWDHDRREIDEAEWARSASTKLGVSRRDGLAVFFDMRLGRFRAVVHCVFVVTAG